MVTPLRHLEVVDREEEEVSSDLVEEEEEVLM